MKIKAQGEAEANKVISQSLSDKVIENKKIEKWNGELPATVAGQDVMLMLPTAEKTTE